MSHLPSLGVVVSDRNWISIKIIIKDRQGRWEGANVRRLIQDAIALGRRTFLLDWTAGLMCNEARRGATVLIRHE